MIDDLVQFLRARLDEDEETARAATPGPWVQSGIGEYGWGVTFDRPASGVEADDSDQGRADADHIARHDPARVLRDVEAKRQIVDHVSDELDATDTPWWYDDKLTPILKALALPYSDHPDYRDDWRP